jgi:hypothetical protein
LPNLPEIASRSRSCSAWQQKYRKWSSSSPLSRAPVSGGVLPPAFESLEDAGFDFGGDVAVYLDQSVG